MTKHNTILYIADRANSGDSVFATLSETGCEVVSTDTPTEGIALLYIMRSVLAVVLDIGVRDQTSFDVEQSLRKIRPDVPVIVLCDDQIDCSRLGAASCQSTDNLVFALQHLLTAELFV